MPRSLPPDAQDPTLDAAVARVHAADLVEEAAEAKAAFHLRMRARGIQDIAVLRAFELVPRRDFVPHRYLDLAARDLALPIGCGQTLDEPWLVARMVAALKLERGQRVLQVGAGSGYATAILAHLTSEVVGLERYQGLAMSAQARLMALDVTNAAVVWGDGLAVPAEVGMFDRILVHGLLTELPTGLMERLTTDGLVVCARPAGEGQAITRVAREGDMFVETPICPCRLQPILPGLAASL